MNTLKRFAVLILLAVSVAACTTMQPAQKSLYDRLGGKEAITAVVQHLWGVVAKDDRINGFFAHTKPEAFAGQLIDFLCQGSGGMPARSASTAKASAVSGVSPAGLQTTVQPAASAGAHFRVIIAAGKFHGVIAPTTPIGCLMTTMRASSRWLSEVSP